MKKKIKKFINRFPRLGTPKTTHCECLPAMSDMAEELRIETVLKDNALAEVLSLRKALRECWRLSKKCESAEAVTKVVIETLCLQSLSKSQSKMKQD